MRPKSVNIISKKDGEHVSVAGNDYRLIFTGSQRDNAFTIIEMVVPPGGGPNPHAHPSFQGLFYVLDGEVIIKSETQHYKATKGDFVHIPKGGAIHCFKNESDEPARLLCLAVPAGLDAFFKEISKIKLPFSEKEKMLLEKIGANYGQEFFPPTYLDR